MKKPIKNSLYLGIILLAVSGTASASSRWFSDEQLVQGKKVFTENCSTCHGDKAQGTKDWKKTGKDGKYPPPPLNGNAHAWHHSMDILRRTVREGGIPLGGSMPAFKDKLDAGQVDAAIAYFQSQWSNKIYNGWASRNLPAPKIAQLTNSKTVTKTQEERKETAAVASYLKKVISSGDIGTPEKTAVPSMLQVKLGNDYAYLSDDGRYLFTGELIDLKTQKNLTRERKAKDTLALLKQFPEQDKIVFSAKDEEKASITVFTDTSCPYCRKLHSEMPALQKAGVTVKYIAFPRAGLQGAAYETMKSVWCSEDRQKALSIAKSTYSSSSSNKKDCEAGKAVDTGYELGKQIGITGTPAIILSNGELISGYVPQKQLLRRLGL